MIIVTQISTQGVKHKALVTDQRKKCRQPGLTVSLAASPILLCVSIQKDSSCPFDHVSQDKTGVTRFFTILPLTHAHCSGLITFFVPCYTAGKNAEKVGESCVLHCFLSFVPILNVWCHANVRGKIRDQKSIDVSIDVVVVRKRCWVRPQCGWAVVF